MRKRALGRLLSIVLSASMVISAPLQSFAYSGDDIEADEIVIEAEESAEESIDIVDEITETEPEDVQPEDLDEIVIEDDAEAAEVEDSVEADTGIIIEDEEAEPVISDMEVEAAVKVTAVPADTSFGEAFGNKKASDIQDEIEIEDILTISANKSIGDIYGTLKQVVGWTTGWGKDTEGNQITSGHYIALHVDAPADAKKIEAGIGELESVSPLDSEEVVDAINKIDYRLVDLTADPDKSIILRIKDKEAQIIKVFVTNKDDSVVEKYYSTSTLDYEGFEVTSNFGDEEPVINGKKPQNFRTK